MFSIFLVGGLPGPVKGRHSPKPRVHEDTTFLKEFSCLLYLQRSVVIATLDLRLILHLKNITYIKWEHHSQLITYHWDA